MKSFACFFGVLLFPFVFASTAYAEYETLEQALGSAYQNNPSLEAERTRLRATDEQVSLALSHWRPSIEATSSIGKNYQRIPAQQGFDAAHFAGNTTSYGAQITQPLFRGFRTLTETEAAKKMVLAGRARLQAAEQKLLFETATAFLDVVRDELILKADRDNEIVLRKKLDETSARFNLGDLTKTDVEQAKSRLARSEVATLQTRNSLMADRAAYVRLVGHEPGSLAKPVMTTGGLGKLDDILRLATTRNPSVIAARYTLEKSDAEIADNKGTLLPELNLVGSTSRNFGEDTTTPGRYASSQVLLQLRIPLFEAGADHARIRAAQQTGVQYRMELEDVRNRALETAHNAWQALLMTEASIKADMREIEAAASALEGVKIEVRLGSRTTLDELNAEQELLEAKTDLAKADHDRILAIMLIKSAIGELTADALKLPLDPYDPRKHYDDNHARWVGFGGADDDIYIKSDKTETQD